MAKKQSYDVVIIGSGFSGTLTALCLRQSGLSVCVLEKQAHPRFAVGESSTPIADMILRSLSETYNLPWLKHFSRYGSWQKNYPDITCGLKRGFSYYKHKPHEHFTTGESHANELLVAASSSDEQSDTNWLRSEFDAFLAMKLPEYEIPFYDRAEIISVVQNSSDQWIIESIANDHHLSIRADFMLDATGSPRFLENFLGISTIKDGFETQSHAVFSHFEHVKPWKEFLEENHVPTDEYPYNPDYSALHHLLQEGWLWMLRFDNGITSAGLLLNLHQQDETLNTAPNETWSSIIRRYPSLKHVFEHAIQAGDPGQLIQTQRLQRRLKQLAGRKWAALPHTAGFIDPMHSTGIAHTLCGVEKLVTLLKDHLGDAQNLSKKLKVYEQSVKTELQLIDQLVAGSYRSMHHFELFHTFTMLYFIAAISYEQRRLRDNVPSHFLCADHEDIFSIVRQSYEELKSITAGETSEKDAKKFRERVKSRIAPYNNAGLLNPDSRNMYRHTAVTF